MNKGYQDRVKDVAHRAGEMKESLVFPALDDATGMFIEDNDKRNAVLDGAVKGSIFEAAGKGGGMILASASNAVRMHCAKYGRMPSDELLASAHRTIENALFFPLRLLTGL